ncbi:MAG: hypothetical protein ACJ8DZ_02395 [Allosphingosinicella sp.]
MDWHEIKAWLEHASGLDMDALHVHAGVALQLLFALILRRPLSSPWPWLGVAAAEAANEYYDLAYETWPERGIQFAEGARDYWNTLLIPTLLLLLCRYAPRLFTGSGADAGQAGGEAGGGGDGADQAHQG